jgi:hypothetical protein
MAKQLLVKGKFVLQIFALLRHCCLSIGATAFSFSNKCGAWGAGFRCRFRPLAVGGGGLFLKPSKTYEEARYCIVFGPDVFLFIEFPFNIL